MAFYDHVPIYQTATIDSSQTSSAVDLEGLTLSGVRTTTGLISTSITFLSAELSTGTYLPLVTSTGGTVTVTVSTSAAQQISIDPVNFLGVRHVKVKTASTESNKTFTLLMRPWGL